MTRWLLVPNPCQDIIPSTENDFDISTEGDIDRIDNDPIRAIAKIERDRRNRGQVARSGTVDSRMVIVVESNP